MDGSFVFIFWDVKSSQKETTQWSSFIFTIIGVIEMGRSWNSVLFVFAQQVFMESSWNRLRLWIKSVPVEAKPRAIPKENDLEQMDFSYVHLQERTR